MKKIFRFTYILLVAALATAVSSCTDKYEYDPAVAEGEQVYFDQDETSTIEITKDKSSFTIPIYRVKTEGTLTVPLSFTAGEGNIYSLPSEVTFENGKASALITVNYDPDKLEYGNYTGGTIAVGDQKYTTPYGFSSFTFKAGVTEWVDMILDGKPATATYREDLVASGYSLDNLVYQVPIQESKIRKGMYRLVNPYGKLYPNNEPGDYDTSADHYMVINAMDPDFVYVETFKSGMAWGDGELSFTSLISFWLAQGNSLATLKSAHPDMFGRLENGVITMPAGSMLINYANYKPDSWYYANKNGLFAVVLPGYVLADYSASFELSGRLTNTDDEDFAQGMIKLGEDVASAKVVLVPAGTDVDATASGIIDGSVPAVEALSSGVINVPFTDTGDYTMVIVAFNEKGDAVKVYTQTVSLLSSKDNAEQFTDIAAGVFHLGSSDFSSLVSEDGASWGYLDESFPKNQEAVLSQSSTDPTHFRLTPWLPFDGTKPLDFHWDQETGTLTVDNSNTGLESEDGYIYATDAMSYSSKYFAGKNVDSKYDKATNKLHFFLLYTGANYEGLYACEEEVFEITDTGGAKALKTAMAKAKLAPASKTSSKQSYRKHFTKKLIERNNASMKAIN